MEKQKKTYDIAPSEVTLDGGAPELENEKSKTKPFPTVTVFEVFKLPKLFVKASSVLEALPDVTIKFGLL